MMVVTVPPLGRTTVTPSRYARVLFAKSFMPNEPAMPFDCWLVEMATAPETARRVAVLSAVIVSRVPGSSRTPPSA